MFTNRKHVLLALMAIVLSLALASCSSGSPGETNAEVRVLGSSGSTTQARSVSSRSAQTFSSGEVYLGGVKESQTDLPHPRQQVRAAQIIRNSQQMLKFQLSKGLNTELNQEQALYLMNGNSTEETCSEETTPPTGALS